MLVTACEPSLPVEEPFRQEEGAGLGLCAVFRDATPIPPYPITFCFCLVRGHSLLFASRMFCNYVFEFIGTDAGSYSMPCVGISRRFRRGIRRDCYAAKIYESNWRLPKDAV